MESAAPECITANADACIQQAPGAGAAWQEEGHPLAGCLVLPTGAGGSLLWQVENTGAFAKL